MPALDKLLDTMNRFGAEEAVLCSGQPPRIVGQDGDKNLNGKELSSSQILGILAEVAPPQFHSEVKERPRVSFHYSPPAAARPVRVDLSQTQGRVHVNLRWAAVDGVGPTGIELDLPDTPPGAAPGAGPVAPAPLPPPTAAAAAVDGQVTGRKAPRIDDLFEIVVEQGASDLHLCVGNPPLMRLHGDMVPVEGWPVFASEALEKVLLEIAPDKNREEFRRDNDTDFGYPFRDLCRFRCNLFRDQKGPGGVFRQIPNEILTPEQIGLPRKVLDLCFLSKGLVVVTGPTGSGKSTTLATMVDYLNDRRRDHIITIEDPIEFVHRNKCCLVNQREVGTHTTGFKRALRAALREDPDVVLVGEMRDLETVAIAIETAETGHLVFGTLHTNTAASTIDRIIDQFPSDRQDQIRVMLSETLKGVIAQTLCKKKGGGRVAAFEILFGIPSVANLIREGKTFQIPSIMQTGRQHGMVTMNHSLLQLVLDGVIEPAQGYLKSVDQLDMLALFKRSNIPFDPSKHDIA